MRGDSTLTKDKGLDFIFEAIETGRPLERLIPKPGRGATTGHVWAYSKINRLLRSPILRKVLIENPPFSFNANSRIFALVNGKEMPSWDARALGLLLISQAKETVVPNYRPYVLESHVDLIEQDRFIIGVNTLSELPKDLRQAALDRTQGSRPRHGRRR